LNPRYVFLLYFSAVTESLHSATLEGAGELTELRSRSNLQAALLSLIVPGTGHLYLGRRHRAIVVLALLAALLIGFWPLRLLHSYFGFCLLYGGWIAVYVYAPLSALIARGVTLSKPASKWWLTLLVPLSLLAAELLGIGVTRASGFRSFEVPSTSMERTIQKGDRIVADVWYYKSRSPERDEVIIFKRKDTFFVKRVIAVGGDNISGRDRSVLLNGQILDEPFVEHRESLTASSSNTFGPVTVPRDKFFVMGDNRDDSLDSRSPSFGLVDKSSIVGKTLYIFASGRQGTKIQ
jgi:signal peptidase I